ncbi:hypothetical protein R1flu_025353 [Riccia fluitans]|uniref:DDE-1 domain-containing protein n=1 Tax=Riccia fluitans TaxID=41844 RepID=A0ABD1Y0J2_9MARC
MNQSKLPANYEEQIEAMVLRIAYLVCAYRIPVELVINGDQTGTQLLPVSRERTYALKGCQKVAVAGAGDKRQITLLVSSSAAGDLLPFQVIYSGKTRNSLPSPPRLMFLKEQGWNLTCTETHWSTIASMKEYIHQRPLKAAIHREFQIWAAREVARELDNEHSDVSSFKLNISMRNLQDKSCDFLWAAHQHVREMREMVVKGWEKSKILEAWKVEKQMASFEPNRNSQLFVEEETFILDWEETGFDDGSEEWLDETVEGIH